jgi:hypothetical protein
MAEFEEGMEEMVIQPSGTVSTAINLPEKTNGKSFIQYLK